MFSSDPNYFKGKEIRAFNAPNPFLVALNGHRVGDIYINQEGSEDFQLIMIGRNHHFTLVAPDGCGFTVDEETLNTLIKTGKRQIDWFAWWQGHTWNVFHGPLSNFWPDSQGLSLEHRFQAAKAIYFEQKLEVLAASTPGLAKKIGRKVELVHNWDDDRYQIMQNLLAEKFMTDDFARKYLIATDRADLTEKNWWGDEYWGVNMHGKGKNWLGTALMDLREALIAGEY